MSQPCIDIIVTYVHVEYRSLLGLGSSCAMLKSCFDSMAHHDGQVPRYWPDDPRSSALAKIGLNGRNQPLNMLLLNNTLMK